jgi:hypothetical protein
MAGMRLLVGMTLALAAAAAAAPAASARDNAAPRILEARATLAPDRTVRVVVVGRDRDDVVRGAEIDWGEPGPAQGLSACEESARPNRADRRRRGRRARFDLAYAYAAPGHYTITVRVLSGGCGKRPQQRSAARTLTVHVS